MENIFFKTDDSERKISVNPLDISQQSNLNKNISITRGEDNEYVEKKNFNDNNRNNFSDIGEDDIGLNFSDKGSIVLSGDESNMKQHQECNNDYSKDNIYTSENDHIREMEEDDNNNNNYNYNYSYNQTDYIKDKKRKAELLTLLQAYQNMGHELIKDFNMNDSVDSIEIELARIQRKTELDTSMKTLRNLLIWTFNGMEGGSHFIKWKGKQLFNMNGYALQQTAIVNKGDFDTMLLEIYEKYGNNVQLPVEIRLAFSMISSAAAYAYQNSIIESQKQEIDFLKQKLKMKGPSINFDGMYDDLSDMESVISNSDNISQHSVKKEPALIITQREPKRRGRPKKGKD